MNTPSFLQEMARENEQLQRELKELEYLIEMKEEELLELKQAVASISEIQSRLSMNMDEVDMIREKMTRQKELILAAQKREHALEEEIIYSIETEKNYYELKEEYQCVMNMLETQQEELKTTPAMVKELADLRSKLTEALSEIELLQLDNQYLREDLQSLQNRQPDFFTTNDDTL